LFQKTLENNQPKQYDLAIWNILQKVVNKSMVFHAFQENHVEAHIQEIPENGSDSAHFGILHVEFRVLKLLKYIFTHEWTCSAWAPCEAPENHKAKFRIGHRLLFFGRCVPFSHLEVEVWQIGPSLVVLNLSHMLGDFIITETVTPIAPLFQRITHGIYGKNNMFTRLVAISFLSIFTEMFTRDMMIWRNKTYKSQPILVKNDGNIMPFRRWYRQSYPKKSAIVDGNRNGSPENSRNNNSLSTLSESW